jgi:hypothetical protein
MFPLARILDANYFMHSLVTMPTRLDLIRRRFQSKEPKKELRGGLQVGAKFIKQNWFWVVYTASIIGGTWAVLYSIQVLPRDFLITTLREEVAKKDEIIERLEKQLAETVKGEPTRASIRIEGIDFDTAIKDATEYLQRL